MLSALFNHSFGLCQKSLLVNGTSWVKHLAQLCMRNVLDWDLAGFTETRRHKVQPSWAAVAEMEWPTKQKMYLAWPFTEVCRSLKLIKTGQLRLDNWDSESEVLGLDNPQYQLEIYPFPCCLVEMRLSSTVSKQELPTKVLFKQQWWWNAASDFFGLQSSAPECNTNHESIPLKGILESQNAKIKNKSDPRIFTLQRLKKQKQKPKTCVAKE